MEHSNTKNHGNKKSKKKKKRMSVVIFVVFSILAVVSALIGGYTYTLLDKMESKNISKNKDDLGINKEAENRINTEDPNSQIINIAFFGLDKREKNEAGRSDAIMIATIDKKHKKIKLSSVMRDTYVNVSGHGMTKITHAYAYGGPQLAIKTLNENFQLNIKDYVTVDFFSLEKIIDTVGGVQINVKKEEIPLMNSSIAEVANLEKATPSNISKTGLQNLNGMQAVAYTRVRYTGNGDYERTERQRTVLTAVFNKIQQGGVTKYPSLVATLLPYVETSISKLDLISMGTGVMTSGSKTLEQERFPLDAYSKGQTIKGVWYLVTDLKATTDQIHKYIYDDIKPESKK